jgi:hypothetical protein
MNTQTERRRKTRSRQFRRPERRLALHRRPPLSKEAVPSMPGREQSEVEGRNPLPVARPIRRTTGLVEGRGKEAGLTTPAAAPGPSKESARSRSRRVQFDVRMAFTLLGFAVAAVLAILFGLDLAMAVPFGRVSLLMDVSYVFCGIILGWLSWSCFRDLW